MDRVATDRFYPSNPGHHRAQVTTITQVRPVRRHPGAQSGGPADVEHPVTGVPEPVDAGRAGQPWYHGRPVGRHQAAPPTIQTDATWQVSARDAVDRGS